MRSYIIAFCLLLFPVAWGCQKVVNGYLSGRLFYQINPFYVQQGVTTVSSPLVSEGSTEPLNVKLISIVNEATGQSADSQFLKPQTMKTFISAVDYTDSSLASLNAKLKDSTVPPFAINPIGGRLEFTQSSQYLDTGTYDLSIQASNVRGSETLNNICQMIVTPISTVDTILYQAWTNSDSLGNFITLGSALQMTMTYYPNGGDKVVYEFKDKNGNNFNPSLGEVHARVGRPTFHDWDPYYPVALTDTSIEYPYPDGIPYLPAFSISSLGSGFASGMTYYQVDYHFTDLRQNVNPVSTVGFFVTKGEYIITYYLNNVTRVP